MSVDKNSPEAVAAQTKQALRDLIGLHVTAHNKLDHLVERQSYIEAKVNLVESNLKKLVDRLGMILEGGPLGLRRTGAPSCRR